MQLSEKRAVPGSGKGRGVFYAIFGTMLWGVSGSVAQYLFAAAHLSPTWLVGVRLLSAGLLLLAWYGIATRGSLWAIWRQSGWRLIIFGLLGMMPSQATYFMAISYGNAATATVLQFLGPLFIIIYLATANREWPRRIDMFSIVLALAGTYLLVTQGRLTSLALSVPAVIWGVLAGVSQASYTLLPRRLLREFDARLVVGWAMILGSVIFWPQLVTVAPPALTAGNLLGIAFIVVGGTMFAYLLYLKSLAHISPSATGMLSAFEPLTATFVAVVFLGTHLAAAEVFGGALILVTTVLQALPQKPFAR
ncbi:MAG: DMT family transporter [Lactobacillus sp.]|jgi:drug/metabolite transporter (DMT)-like permease|nr:DMT family transporter [Lactobacillus sp.]MCI2033606.1 DMT family transporter [Lactobacillus sp.]